MAFFDLVYIWMLAKMKEGEKSGEKMERQLAA